jgi:O-antigen chain-terminating methyltransferase
VEEGLRPLAAELADVEGRVVDVGCGRGEMLTVLGERGVDAYGVDLDLGMVSRCQERGLEVVRSDILAHLLELPDRTLGGLVAGGLAEEWPIVRLVSMLRAARRKLRPGGVLLLYGPDPLDPAGQSALADDPLALRGFGPDGLAALVEQEGFRAVRGSRVGSNYVVRASIT